MDVQLSVGRQYCGRGVFGVQPGGSLKVLMPGAPAQVTTFVKNSYFQHQAACPV
ncbi:hypothetical protein [Pseudomonas sp. KNUC1026]|uniref:hypothetical protein n=1 Tax=Pseudomonas sp. KNUC1026 TaxID=2893890 RepID=UPI001F434F0B|nr:hypothetical protein [Pseudomonas sp. KNUC1026]UFH50920.1 hypothetical protein LN139_07470 [Pseudomonas sp. KNUC1026]